MAERIGIVAGIGRVRLTLELTATQQPPNGEIEAVALLTMERPQSPLSGRPIRFYLGPNVVEEVDTSDDGRASCTFRNLGFGTHAVSVQVNGVAVTSRHTFAKPLEKPKIPASLSVTITGPRGQQELLIRIAAEDGSPIPGFDCKVVDGYQIVTVKTNSDGTAVYPTNFTESNRYFEVQVGAKPGLAWRARLLGPKGARQLALFTP